MKTKRIFTLLLCMTLILCMVSLPTLAKTDEIKTVEVTVLAQAEGGFLAAPGILTVSEDTAENYGFSDSVDGVSVLDVLVKEHEIVFGEDFTADTANDYLSAGGGYVSTLFGINTYNNGFLLNEGAPNDGTESSYGGYNGTTVVTQEVKTGDKIDFFIYQDTSYYSDIYTWIDGTLSAAPGGEAEVAVTGSTVMMGFKYKTPEDFKASAEAAEGVSLAWVGENGELTEIEGVSTDEDGNAVFTIPADMPAGTYYLTATGTDDYDTPVLMNPVKFTITDEITVFVSISENAAMPFANNGKLFNKLPVTLSGKLEYNIDDALIAAHEKYADINHGYASALSQYGLSIVKLWGNESGNYGYWQNDSMAWSLTDKVSDSDFISAFVYKDNVNWKDSYTKFESNEVSAEATAEVLFTLKQFDFTSYGYVPCEGAHITVSELPDLSAVTDENGCATLIFPQEGIYTVIAENDSLPLVPSSCKVNVSAPVAVTGITAPKTLIITENQNAVISYEIIPQNASNKTVSWESSDNSIVSVKNGVITGVKAGSADITVRTNDGSFTSVCSVTVKEAPDALRVMHNIAEKYTKGGIALDMNAPWFAADLSAYKRLYPDTENFLTENQIQDYLDEIIPSADTASSPGELSKYIISLRALGYDPTDVLTADFRHINIVDKLKTLISENDERITNIYTLPYVIISMCRDGYLDDELTNALILSALDQKTAWQNTDWGTDAAAAMVTALAPFYETNEEVKSALNETLLIIMDAQTENGVISGNAASTGLALTALSELGIDGAEIKNGEKSAIDGILTYTTDTLDGFNPNSNSFATEQSFRGLVAWQLLDQQNEKDIFDFSANPKNTAQASWGEHCPVTFNAIPANSLVEVEGQAPAAANKYDLPAGEYKYTASSDGYLTASGTFTVSEDEENTHTPKTINISLSGKPSSGSSKISVTLNILTHDKNECDGSYTYKKNASAYKALTSGTVSLSSGQTVFDALHLLLQEKNVDYVEKTFGYISSIGGVSEFDHGPNSGWLFMVNGKTSQTGCRNVTLTKNSVITWFYTDDYTEEKGSEPWKKSSGGSSVVSYTVKFETDGGTEIKSQSIQKNGKISAPSAPAKEGFVFVGWYIDKELTKEYDANAEINGNITLYAKWAVNNDEKAYGIDKNAWYYDGVKYVLENNIMQATDNGFEPNAEITRATLITILYNAEGSEPQDGECKFSDVNIQDSYFGAAVWGSKNGIITGTSDTSFSPNEKVTREQAALIIYRYAKMKGYFNENYSDLSGFNDNHMISDWALNSVKWANAVKLINGTTDNLISPKDSLTRAQIALILMRFYENVAK